MSGEPKLYMRRVDNASVITDPLTIGKLYQIVGHSRMQSREYPIVLDDNGEEWHASSTTLWQPVWVWPNGTEVGALE
jgi:hypothetical protein